MSVRFRQTNGTIRFFKDNSSRVLHREDGPAVIMANGLVAYYKFGKLHREDGPALVDTSDKIATWYYEGKAHRDDGPAVISARALRNKLNKIAFFKHGVPHRKDGPAVIHRLEVYPYDITYSYIIDGVELAENNKAIDFIEMKYFKITDEERELDFYFKELQKYIEEANNEREKALRDNGV